MESVPAGGKIGKYEVVGIVGEGGMGIVYKAVDPLLGRVVAIKKMTAAFEKGSELQKRFFFEARSVANLQHPNIVVVFDMGDDGGYPFLVMEYLTGESLATIIATRQELPLLRKLDIVIQICQALHYAHEHQLVHRDVKPANVIVMPDGRAKLLDFGIAHAADKGITSTGQVLGTINYISPEQLCGGEIGPRTDVFSTGVVLYQALTYELPFDAPNTAATINRVLHEPPAPLSNYLEDYPPELDEIMERALAKKPEDRYPSTDEMATDLIRLFDRVKRDTLSDYIKRARASIAKAELEAAHESLEAALKLDTKHALAKQLIYEVEQVMDKQQARQELSRIIGDAETAMRQKQFDEAICLVDRALAQDKTDTQLLSLRDQIRQAKARKEKVGSLLNLAAVAEQAGELPMARKATEDALELDPQDTQARDLHTLLLSQIARQEKKREMQGLLDAAHENISARNFDKACELMSEAERIDAAEPELANLKSLIEAGRQQETRRKEIDVLCSEIEEALASGDLVAACLKAERANKKFPSEPELVKLRARAEHERDERDSSQYIENQLAECGRLVEEGELASALKLVHLASQRYPGDSRLQSRLESLRVQAEETAAKQASEAALRKAEEEMERDNLDDAARALESALAKLPRNTELNQKLQQVREALRQRDRGRKLAALEKKVAQLLQQNDYSRARTILDRAAAELGEETLEGLRARIEDGFKEFSALVTKAAAKVRQMLDEGRLDEAALFVASQNSAYEQVGEFTEAARLVAEQQDQKRLRALRSNKPTTYDFAEPTATIISPHLLEQTLPSAPVPSEPPTKAESPQLQNAVSASEPVVPLAAVASGSEPGTAVAARLEVATTTVKAACETKAVSAGAERKPPWRFVAIVAGVLVVVAIALFAYLHRRSTGTAATSPVEIVAEPWGVVETIVSSTGEVIKIEQETPLKIELPPGNYSVVISTPSGAKQSGNFSVGKEGPNTYRHVCEGVDVQELVESY